MSRGYDAWEKYDVDKAMKQIDEQIEKEEKEKEIKLLNMKKNIAVEDAGNSAEVQATKAAIAALKAKKLAERKRKQEDDIQEKASALDQQAKLLQHKSKCIQTAMRARSAADELQAKCSYTQAIATYRQGIDAIDELDKVIEQLENIHDQVQEEKSTQQVAPPCNSSDHHHNNESHSCSSCNDKDKKPTKPKQSIPKSSDLKGISKMLRVDCLIGTGKCEMEQCHYAAASEAFKEAILQDSENLDAWKLRANAFQAMGAPLIAMLHWNKVVLVEGDNSDAKHELDEIEAELIAEPVDEELSYKTALKYLARPTPSETLSRIILLREEADIMMVEGFYIYATNKYKAILDTLKSLNISHNALDQLRIACHVNIASGYLEMKKYYAKAVDHCLAALELEPQNGAVHFRLGQAYRHLFKFDLARSSLKQAASAYHAHDAAQLQAIRQELERNEFDASELDVNYHNLKVPSCV